MNHSAAKANRKNKVKSSSKRSKKRSVKLTRTEKELLKMGLGLVEGKDPFMWP